MSNKIISILFWGGIFLFLLLFYTELHPILITTPDDWHYFSSARDLLPDLNAHNPARLFPEVFPAIVAIFSIELLRPLEIDIITAFAYGTAFVLSLTICIYLYNFYLLVKRLLGGDNINNYFVTLFFLLFHYLAFRKWPDNNIYLLGSFSLTCYYFYTIPILLNVSFVMYFIHSNLLDKLNLYSPWKIGFLFVGIYLCIFSNLYSAIILSSFVFIRLIFCVIYSNNTITYSLKQNKTSLLILVLFLLSMCFEAFGENAQNLTTGDQSYFNELSRTVALYLSIPHRMDFAFKIFALACFFLYFYLYRLTHAKQIIVIFANWLCINLFYILISARAIPDYVVWQDRILAEMVWLIGGLAVCIGLCASRIEKIKAIVPFVFLLLLCHTNTNKRTFNDVYGLDDYSEMNKKILSITREADLAGKDTISLFVPYNNQPASGLNWPFCMYLGHHISSTLYSFRHIRRPICINIVPVKNKTDISADLLPSEVESVIDDNFWLPYWKTSK